MSQTENKMIQSFNEDNYFNQNNNKEAQKNMSFPNNSNYPVLIQKGDQNYKYFSKNKI
jgi:hypothetical protein